VWSGRPRPLPLTLLVRSRSSTQNSRYDNPLLINVQIVDDSVIANSTAPRGGLSLESLDVSTERILLHREQRVLNACLIFWRKF